MFIGRVVVLAGSFAVISAVAAAQETVPFTDLQTAVRLEQRVAIKDVSGDTIRGKVIDISPSAIKVRVDDALGASRTRTFDRATLSTIRRSDRLWNGLLIGSGAGFLATGIWTRSLCGPAGYDSECAAIVTGVGWVSFVPIGAVAGALIDKAIGNQVLYRSLR